ETPPLRSRHSRCPTFRAHASESKSMVPDAVQYDAGIQATLSSRKHPARVVPRCARDRWIQKTPARDRAGGCQSRSRWIESRGRDAQAAPPSWLRIGRLRSRLPVAAKIAFVTAGGMIAAPGSPTPPHFLPPVSARYTSVFGASLRRTTG